MTSNELPPGKSPVHPPSIYQPPLGGWANGARPSEPHGSTTVGGAGPGRWKWPLLGALCLGVVLLIALGAALMVDGGGVSSAAGSTTTTLNESRGNSTTIPPTTTTADTEPSTTGPDTSSPNTSSPDTSNPDTSSPADKPSTTSKQVVVTPQMQEQVDEIIAFVEKTRQLKFKTKPTVRFADDDEFESLLLKDFDEDSEEMAKSTTTYRALGFIDPTADLESVMRRVLALGVVGFYDPKTKELVVRGTSLSPYVRTVVAHELTHALDDQHFDLDREDLDEATDESGYGFTVLVEGAASYVEQAYRATYSSAEESQARSEELSISSDPAIFTIPMDVVKLISGPYVQGPKLIEKVLREDGFKGLNSDYSAPPISSEQTLSPEKYLARERVLPVPAPAFDGTEVEHGSMGQYVLTVLLQSDFDQNMDSPEPETVGWAGDQYVSFKGAEGECISFDVAMDDSASAQRLQTALAEWADTMPDATATKSDTTVSVTSCVASSGGGGGTVNGA